MYGPSALRAFVTFVGFLLPALLIFLAVSLLARILRDRASDGAEGVSRRVAALEREVAELRRRLDQIKAQASKS